MTAAQAAGAGDAIRLEHGKRGVQGLDSAQMRAVGAGAGHKFGTASKQERNIAALDHGTDGLDAIDQGALVGLVKSKKNGRDVAGRQSRVHGAREGRGLL